MFKLNPTYYLVVIVALGSFYGLHKGIVSYEVSNAVTHNKEVMNAEYTKELLLAAKKAKEVENALQNSALALEKTKNEKIESLDTKLAASLDELRKRPNRPTTDNPTTTPDSKACTGRELYREDAEFLTRESVRADKVVVERDYYYEQYEDVRKKLYEASK